MSPAALIPHYDDDTKSPLLFFKTDNSILFLWSKGSRQIHAYHILDSSIYVLPSFDGAELQSSVSFLPKKVVDIRSVEIIQGLRFTSSKIERFGFSIPRNRVPRRFLD